MRNRNMLNDREILFFLNLDFMKEIHHMWCKRWEMDTEETKQRKKNEKGKNVQISHISLRYKQMCVAQNYS